jgi:hypothetical protein
MTISSSDTLLVRQRFGSLVVAVVGVPLDTVVVNGGPFIVSAGPDLVSLGLPGIILNSFLNSFAVRSRVDMLIAFKECLGNFQFETFLVKACIFVPEVFDFAFGGLQSHFHSSQLRFPISRADERKRASGNPLALAETRSLLKLRGFGFTSARQARPHRRSKTTQKKVPPSLVDRSSRGACFFFHNNNTNYRRSAVFVHNRAPATPPLLPRPSPSTSYPT